MYVISEASLRRKPSVMDFIFLTSTKSIADSKFQAVEEKGNYFY